MYSVLIHLMSQVELVLLVLTLQPLSGEQEIEGLPHPQESP